MSIRVTVQNCKTGFKRDISVPADVKDRKQTATVIKAYLGIQS